MELPKITESMALKAFPNGPAPQMPMVLSERYKRSTRVLPKPKPKRTSKPIQEDESDEDDEEKPVKFVPARHMSSDDDSPLNLMPGSHKNSIVSNSLGKSMQPKPSMRSRTRNSTFSNGSRMASANQKSGSPDEPSYQPFPLADFSSYNPAKLTPMEMVKMGMITRAKYLAYSQPPSVVSEHIAASELRAKNYLKDEHRKIHGIIDSAKKKWALLHRAVEDPFQKEKGEALAKLAQKRMELKVRRMIETREEELQFLVEGQQSSIDAIRLKEHLVIHRRSLKKDANLTEKERLRLQELVD